jgi:hypothetical protein
MEGQAQGAAAAAAAGQAAKPSLAAWKQGAVQMTMASAGELVAKTAPKQQKSSSSKAAVKRPKGPEKPFLEKTKEERFGTKPREVNMSKQVKDVLQFLEAHQARESPISWEEIVRDGIPAW